MGCSFIWCGRQDSIYIFSPLGEENYGVAAVKTGGKRQPTGLSHWSGFESRTHITKAKGTPLGCLLLWCGRQDSNLHALALEPKSNESTNSTTPAYSVDSGEWTADNYCFAVLTMAVSIFSSSLQSL